MSTLAAAFALSLASASAEMVRLSTMLVFYRLFLGASPPFAFAGVHQYSRRPPAGIADPRRVRQERDRQMDVKSDQEADQFRPARSTDQETRSVDEMMGVVIRRMPPGKCDVNAKRPRTPRQERRGKAIPGHSLFPNSISFFELGVLGFLAFISFCGRIAGDQTASGRGDKV